MPRSRQYERSNEGQVALPNHWLRTCEMEQSYSTYNQVTMRAKRYAMPPPQVVARLQTPPQWPCVQFGYTTGPLNNSADAPIPYRCLQWTEVGV